MMRKLGIVAKRTIAKKWADKHIKGVKQSKRYGIGYDQSEDVYRLDYEDSSWLFGFLFPITSVVELRVDDKGKVTLIKK